VFSFKNIKFICKWDFIRYVESCGHGCEFCFYNGKLLPVPMLLKSVQEVLPESAFCRCCKGFIIHNIIIFEADIDHNNILYRKKVIPLTYISFVRILDKGNTYLEYVRPLQLEFEAKAKLIYSKYLRK
jgi:hypothetical protein